MRIAFLTFNVETFDSSFAELAKTLAARGHDVKAFYHPESRGPKANLPVHRCRWWNFDIEELLQWNPDRVLVFNGSFVWCQAATIFLQSKLAAKFYFAELAWLPQRHHIFLDPVGPGGRSSLFKVQADDPRIVNQAADVVKENMTFLKSYYMKPGLTPLGLKSNGYIFVPLQVEADTSIVHDSPAFKTNSSLIGFVYKHFSATHKIVVKQHPLDRSKLKNEWQNIVWAGPKIPVNDLSSHALAVIGMNSTSLIEALVHYKPVMSLAYNVAHNKAVFQEYPGAFESPNLHLSVNKEQIDLVLSFLKSQQFSNANPPEWVLERIERGD